MKFGLGPVMGGAGGRLAVALLALGAARAAFAAGGSELTLFAWSEYVPPAVLAGFTAETGIRVRYETFSSGEEMLAKLLAGGTAYDVIQPPDYIAEALIQNHLLAPLDYARLPHFSAILPEFLHPAYDPDQRFTVPYLAGIAGIVVNTARVTRPIRGFADLFAPESQGRIVVMDDGRELVTAALYTLGLGTNDVTAETLARVRPVLARWFQLIKLFDSDSPKTALLNGDVDLGYVWCGEAALLWNQDHKFKFVLPAEGYHLAVDVLAIPGSAEHPGEAHRFIDYVLRPEVSRLISAAFPYTNPNGAARRRLTAEELANPASYPVVRPPVPSFRHLPGSGERIDALITDLKNAR
jgi:spermidine/putrescine transport system substrate-binding protein